MRSVASCLRDGFQAEASRVFATNFYGECVIESQGSADGEIEAIGVFIFNPIENLLPIPFGLLFQDGSERGAGVFRVDIDASAQNSLMTDIAAGQVETALHGQVGFVFDLLCDKFAKNELLGEILGADYDAVLARGAAGEEKGE